MLRDHLDALRERGHGLTEAPASEAIVQQARYVRDDPMVFRRLRTVAVC